MNKVSSNIRLVAISLLISIVILIFDDLKTVATLTQSSKTSSELLAENKYLASKIFQTNNSIKSSSQRLFGGWNHTQISNSGEKVKNTIFFESDATWYHIITRNNGDWYIYDRGTWKFTNGILHEKTESGKSLRGSVKFTSNNEFNYRSDNGTTKWKRISSNKNLSTQQLLGTWSVVTMQRVANSITIDYYQRLVLKLIELKSDGTFRYKSTDARFSALGIEIIRRSGTWQYINSGYADGFLLLKDSQGKVFSVSSLNWSSKGGFLNIHRSTYNRGKKQYTPGKIEKFNRSNLRIN